MKHRKPCTSREIKAFIRNIKTTPSVRLEQYGYASHPDKAELKIRKHKLAGRESEE